MYNPVRQRKARKLLWNCQHIANTELIEKLSKINKELYIHTPIICTPEELTGIESKEV